MRLKSALASVTLGVAALTCAVAPAAQAQTRVFHDTHEESRYDQISTVKVKYEGRNLLIRINGNESFSDHFHVFLDTAGAGYPDYFVGIYAEVEQWGMAGANKWADDESRAPLGAPGCGGKAHYDFNAPSVWISIPRRCIKSPHRVRVNVESVFEMGRVFDRLPLKEQWTPWVHYN